MPLIPDETRNFIHGLSDLWASFFKDADELRAYYEGVQINLGQIYLELLQTLLGTSLKEMPLFSRRYFKLVQVREDRLFYQEGAASGDDRYVFTPEADVLADIEALSNRVLVPTAILMRRRDYEVRSGAVRFLENLFDTDGEGTARTAFAVKIQTVVDPASYTDLLGRAWTGARVGDLFRLRVGQTSTPIYARVVGVVDDELRLETNPDEFGQDLSRRSFSAAVLREPYDKQQTGLLLAANTIQVTRLSSEDDDGALVVGTATVDFSAEPYYHGAWAASTAYLEGDLVTESGALYRARAAHTSGLVFDATAWDAFVGNYLSVHCPEEVGNDGLHQVLSMPSPGVLLLDRANFANTSSARVLCYLTKYTGTVEAGARPSVLLQHTYVDPGTVTIVARRAHDRYLKDPSGEAVRYLAGQAVLEGVDYLVDPEVGQVTFLSAWEPALRARASYSWLRSVLVRAHAARGAWVTLTAYEVGDLVSSAGVVYVCQTAHTSGGAFDPTQFVPYVAPFAAGPSRSIRSMALWGSNVLLDEEALYNTYGYLLDFKKPSSEAYRDFLRGVSQLFLLGPAPKRFESAMNVVAGLPVVRDDDEVLRAYDSGIVHTGTDGQFIDQAEGSDGALDATLGRFTSATGPFFATDVGATLRVLVDGYYVEYTVLSVLSSTTAEISPTPPEDASGLYWTFGHALLTTRFRTTAGSHLFTEEDLNAVVLVESSNNARNVGIFRVIAVENINTVILESTYGFTDETGITWKLSRSLRQRVTTSRATYDFPLLIPLREDVVDPDSLNALTFRAFEPLTEAFRVITYLEDPTWWHHVTIPDAILQLSTEALGRRRVTPEMVEHVHGALDQAAYGDLGLAHGVDDEGQAGQAREGDATWYGANSVVLGFDAGVPVARGRDVGAHLVITTPGFRGFFPILGVSTDGLTLTLGRFPPPEADGTVPPQALDVRLPPLLYRRTVAFVMMDRFLKYHAVRVSIDRHVTLSPELVTDITRLVREAKPSHTFIYLDAMTEFQDEVVLEEALDLALGVPVTEPLYAVPNLLSFGSSSVRYGDAYRYTETSDTVSSVPGTYALPYVVPAGDTEVSLLKLRFDTAVLIGGKHPVEDVDYSLDYAAMTITIISASFPAGPNAIDYVYCVRRLRSALDALDAGETRLAYGGSDPTIVRATGQLPADMGLIDRAVTITLGP